MSIFIMILGAVIFILRLSPHLLKHLPFAETSPELGAGVQPFKKLPSVSIIIPVRNEEENIIGILSSMMQLTYPQFEIIVVDDNSEDNTVEIIQTLPTEKIKLVKAGEKPSSWIGKSWACHVGVQEASGEYLLFTDADTVHYKRSLDRAMSYMRKQNLDMMSALPYHECVDTWEELMGPFHMLVMAITSPYTTPSPSRLFAIGQYLLVKKDAYIAVQGHENVRSELAEDIALARNILKAQKSYMVYPEARLYEVRMFPDLKSFFKGWRRLHAIGFGYSDWKTGIESFLIIAAFLNAFLFAESFFHLSTLLILMAFVYFNQKKYGKFHTFGAVILPFSVLAFIATALAGLWDRFVKKKIEWRGRHYHFDDEKTTAIKPDESA